MPLNLEAKKAVVEEVSAVAKQAHSAIAADYRGMSVAEMTQLRVQARNAGVYMRVVRNTLARRAMENTQFACMRDGLVGPLVLAFSQEEPSSVARVIRDFAKGNEKLKVRLVSFGGALLDPSQIERLANLPTREEALAQLMSVMLAPAQKLVRTLAEPRARLVRTLGAYRDSQPSG